MRIITGSARGTKLSTLDGLETRPTAEMVKEAVFSMIQFEIEGRRFLDVFSGSGQMALEALSRGAQKATMIDISPSATAIIKQNAQKCRLYEKCVVYTGDYKRLFRSFSGREQFDIVYIDPPYSEKLVPGVLEELMTNSLVAENGIIICEDDGKEPFSYNGLTLRRHSKYGRTYITVLENKMTGESEDND